MTEITRAELEQWRANPVTKMLFDDIAGAISDTEKKPRVIYGPSPHEMTVHNAFTDGQISAYEELEGWYQGKLEEDEVNEDEG